MAIPELQDCILDHIAIAVKNISAAKKIYQDLGMVFSTEVEEVKDQLVLTAFAQIDHNAHIELLEPTSSESTIHKFIESKGEGIHHLCFKVGDVKLKTAELTGKGYKFIYPEPRIGAGGCLVNFMHPKSTGGVLIEISQRPDSIGHV
ncbi:MAG TPA: methylmalonyl-CoA epimerase [Bacteriovoracaceae bacterium]|nr:methylmalonyl-CoA epimerase [Bacteriovoracaceae bacterium]